MNDTRTVVGRRVLHFDTIDDLLAEVGGVVEASKAGQVRPLGNWSAAQVLQHLGRMVEFSFDGFPFVYPFWLRVVCRLMRLVSWRWLVAIAFRPGFRNPASAAPLEPDPDVTLDTAAEYLRGQLERIQKGQRMTQPSPAEGPVTHEQWVYAHLRHAELHLSFLLL